MASTGMAQVKRYLLGDQGIITATSNERTVRCLIGWLFLGPLLFVLFELSPTAWALSLSATIILINPRLLKYLEFSTPIKIWLVFSLVSILSALWSVAPARSLQAGATCMWFGFLGAFSLATIRNTSDQDLLRCWTALRAGCWTGILALLMSEIAFAFSAGMQRMDVEHVRTLHKTTFYGTVFATLLLLDGKTKTAALTFVLFAAPTLLMGKTTGINIAIIIIALMYIFPYLRIISTRIVVYGIIFLALISPFITEFIYQNLDHLGILRVERFLSYSARLELWHMLSPQILSDFFLGHGADTLRIAANIAPTPKYYDLKDVPSAHNFAFDIWYDLGLVGLGIICLFVHQLFVCAKKYTSHRWLQYFLFSSIIVFLIEFSVDHRIWLSWAQGFAVFTVFCGALARRIEQSARHQNSF